MEKVVGHVRVSTRRQGRTRYGLKAQKTTLDYFVATNDLLLVKVFVEIGSGRKRHRPKVDETIRYCRDHGFRLLVPNQSRLARNVAFIADLMESGFRFFSADNPGANDFQKHIQAAVDQNVADETRRNTKASLKSAVAKGVKLGGNPAKLKRTLRRKRRDYLKKNKERFQAIQKENATMRARTDAFNRLRVKKINGKRGGWHVSEVHAIYRDLKKIR